MKNGARDHLSWNGPRVLRCEHNRCNPVRTLPLQQQGERLPSLYDRYQAGEHQQVWSDLIALGDAVRNGPAYPDALAVAHETMRRAQSNIETLIARLHDLGYRFAGEQEVAQQSAERMASLTRQTESFRAMASGPFAGKMKTLLDVIANLQTKQKSATPPKKPAAKHPLEDRNVYSRASGASGKGIADAENQLGGPLPISLRAWYEAVEYVSFLGSHPELNPTKPEGAGHRMYVSPSMLQGPGGEQRRRQAESLGFQVASDAPASPLDESALPDPLVITALEELLGESEEPGGGSFIIAPDDLHKANISGDVYYIDLPDRKADLIFQDWKGEYFVAYLRRVFLWAGFPGWERHRNPPTKLIRELTQGLLPL